MVHYPGQRGRGLTKGKDSPHNKQSWENDTTSKDGPWTPSTPHLKLTKTPASHHGLLGRLITSHSHPGNFNKLLNFPHLFLSMSPEKSGIPAPISVDAASCCPEAETPATSKETERSPGYSQPKPCRARAGKTPPATLSRSCRELACAVSQ